MSTHLAYQLAVYNTIINSLAFIKPVYSECIGASDVMQEVTDNAHLCQEKSAVESMALLFIHL